MSIQPADRIHQVEEYYFSKKLKEIQLLNSVGNDVINLGIGSPDLPPPPDVIQVLQTAAAVPAHHGYQPYQGIPEIRAAIQRFYVREYSLNLELSVLPLLGSKEGITHLSMAYLNPGDQVLVPELGYPTYTSVTRMVGAEIVHYPLFADSWEPDWSYLENLDTEKIKLMWINYPHMPTGAKASIELFERLVDFAKRTDILLCHDNPYSMILNDQPLSIFQVSGAEEIALELGSLSKTYNMAGWRVGWMYGAHKLIQPVLQIKSNVDSGMFKPIQLAAVAALDGNGRWLREMNEIYAERREVVFKIMKRLHCQFTMDQNGLFVWGKTNGISGEELAERLLNTSRVFVAPGNIFGASGKDYIRVSLCAPKNRIEEALNRIP